MGLKKLLEERVSQYQENSQEKKVAEWLNAKASEIINDASEHLKYVSHVFPEFDNHDALHSEGVLGIIESLLGDKAKELSIYDLFSLIAVSYLHDCGMAVSDREMIVLNMVEGNPDGQKLISIKESKDLIISNLNHIYGNDKMGFDGEIKNWMFRPANEETFIKDLAELLIDYQSFRNGKIDKIKECKDEELANLNNELRTEYLRITHHKRVEGYIVNWGDTDRGFARFPISGMGKLLANNIAKCCRAHGEDAEYMKNEFKKDELKDETHVLYYGPEASNLQFVAMMLRLGDIIHFSNDRAHPVLRALHQFKSDYSYQQWHIKSNGVSFNVSNGKVSCTAFCQLPKDYYDLWTYVNYIDDELSLFNVLSPKWEDFTKFEIEEKVDRKNIRHDASFTPAHGHKFSLDQNKVLDLLMGAKLYSNEYACLRELYQNSLDACRCQIALAQKGNNNINPQGRIEFGLAEEKRNEINRKFVYCLDNGKGMTRDIIEKYLLHIGSSYYRSSDFFKKQAETGATFTPTSQFGIGMLSCFMIGDEIEITTREEGGEVVSCVMEGPNEYFYYKLPTKEDEEKVPNSGTLVKVFLNEKYQKLLNDDPLEELGYLLWLNLRSQEIKHDTDRWEHHLYRIMNDFIIVVPDGIDVKIELQNPAGGKKSIKIYNKPLPIIEELRPYANINNGIKDDIKSEIDNFKNMEYKVIQDQENGLECRTVIYFTETESFNRYIEVNGEHKCCVDGIRISHLERDKSILYHLDGIVGTFNFIGENRPQLSVSREEIIGSSVSDYDNDARTLLQKLVMESIKEVWAYIKDKGILPDNALYDTIWKELFNKFRICCPILYQCLKELTDCHDMQLPHFRKAMSFGNLLIADETIIPKDMLNKHEYFDPVNIFFIFRLLESESIDVQDENSLMAKGHVGIPAFVTTVYDVYDSDGFDEDYLFFHPSGYNNFWKEYDFVPFGSVIFVSDNIWQIVRDYLNDKSEENDYALSDRWIYLRELYDIDRILSDFNIEINTRRRIDSLSDSFCFGLERKLRIRDLFYKEPNSYHQVEYLGLTTYTQDYSVLAVSEPKSDHWICFARRGKHTRQELLDSITGEWREKIKNVLFQNGEELSPQPVK